MEMQMEYIRKLPEPQELMEQFPIDDKVKAIKAKRDEEIKNILTECIDQEDKRKPLTDEVLMDILNGKGYRIARRTVAKYREMLGIPVARLRKQI